MSDRKRNEKATREEGAERHPAVWQAIAVAVGACLFLSAAPAAAATPEEAKVTAPVPLRPGQQVRVSVAGADGGSAKGSAKIGSAASDSDAMEGRFLGAREGRLLLDGQTFAKRFPDGIPMERVERVWVQGRNTKQGAIVGGTIGGLVLGALYGFLTWGGCDVDGCGEKVPIAVAVGVAGGGSVGAAVGGLLGAASPRWNGVYSAEPAGEGSRPPLLTVTVVEGPPSTVVEGPPNGRHFGSASLHVAYNRALEANAPSGGVGGRFSLTAELGTVRPSLEYGRHGLGGNDVLTARGETLHYEESLFYVGPAVSVGPSRGRVRPYALASLGYYDWTALVPPPHTRPEYATYPQAHRDLLDADYRPTEGHNFLGGSIGGGVRVNAVGMLSFGLEGRWHTSLSGAHMGASETRRLSLLTLSGGLTLRW